MFLRVVFNKPTRLSGRQLFKEKKIELFNNLSTFIKEETARNFKTFKNTLKNSETKSYVTKLKIFWMIYMSMIPDTKPTPNPNLD